jgi:hypothetical protein
MKKAMIFAAAAMLAVGCKKEEKKDTVEMKDSTSVATSEAPEAAPQMDSATMMKKWQDYMTPNENHKMLADEAGMWTTETTSWKDAADQHPQKSTGTADIKMILGGRYQQGMHKGAMMGMPFEGISTVGYDNAQKKYVSTWMDNMGTGIMNMTGSYDSSNKTATFTGKYCDPISGKDSAMREVWTVVDDNDRKMEMFCTGMDGKEYKCMEMAMTRKK